MGIDSILACLCAGPPARPHTYHQIPATTINEKPPLMPAPPTLDDPAAEIVAVLRRTAATDEAALKAELSATNWSEWLAERVFHALRATLASPETAWAVTFTEAYRAARTTAEAHLSAFLRYAREHPAEVAAEVVVEIVLSLVAFGILVRMARWVVRLLGFAEAGPVAGSFAARWEARYAGYIPKGSLFSYIQRMGMTWK